MSVQTILNGVNVTSLVQEGSVTKQASRPTFFTIRLPSDQTTAGETSRCKILLDGTLDAHGICVSIEDQGDEDEMSSTFTFADPTVLFEMRPSRDGPGSGDRGDFSKPSFMTRNQNAPAMVREILRQSLDNSNPADGEGPMGITLGTFAAGGADLRGMPADWPMTIAQTIGLLVDTGELDVRCEPIDSAGALGRIDCWNGDFGEVSAARFEYKTGSYNAIGCRRFVDVNAVMNKLWIYLGPRVGTKSDPQGDQHWAANITGTSPNMPARQTQILNARTLSQEDFFVRMAIRIFDGDESAALELYKRWWQMESWTRLRPKKVVAITPEPGIRPTFTTGDRIYVAAGPAFRGGFSGWQRVQEYTYRWDVNGVVELGAPVGAPGVPAVHLSNDSTWT